MSQKKIRQTTPIDEDRMKVTAPQLMKMVQQQAVTNTQLKIINNAVLLEVMAGFDVISERLCALEDKAWGENKGLFKLKGEYTELVRLTQKELKEN